MNDLTAEQLIETDNRFYARQAGRFAQTRGRAWEGWEKLELTGVTSILDVAGGNGRFYRFARERGFTGKYLDVDSSQMLLDLSQLESNQKLCVDILTCYQNGEDWRVQLSGKKYDLVVCSGFMHHVPTEELRAQLLRDLAELVAANGQLVVSFWQFWPSLVKLVHRDLGHGDYLLTWDGQSEDLRFAHNFADEEVDRLIATLENINLQPVSDYRADGKTHNLNCYVVWRKR